MTAPAASPDAGATTADRYARLGEAVSRLRTRVQGADLDRWFMLAGPAFAVFGLLLVYLGWYGASQTTRVFLQIPYMISGGLLGLGFIVAGSFLYLARWVNHMIDQSRRQADEAHQVAERTLASLERLEALLAAGPAGAPTVARAKAGSNGAGPWVATEKGTMFHRPDCSMVSGRSVHSVNGESGLKPCRICEPDPA